MEVIRTPVCLLQAVAQGAVDAKQNILTPSKGGGHPLLCQSRCAFDVFIPYPCREKQNPIEVVYTDATGVKIGKLIVSGELKDSVRPSIDSGIR